jgi:hypothetical protein
MFTCFKKSIVAITSSLLTHFELKKKSSLVVEIFSYLMAETKDREMSQIYIVSVKFLKDVRDFDRNAANWQ